MSSCLSAVLLPGNVNSVLGSRFDHPSLGGQIGLLAEKLECVWGCPLSSVSTYLGPVNAFVLVYLSLMGPWTHENVCE